MVRGLQTGAFNVYGDYPEITQQQPMDISSGRFINYADINEKRKVAIIGEGVISGLYEPAEEVIGSYIKINGVNFMVIGTYKKKGSNMGDAEEAQKEIYIPFTAFSQAFNMGNRVGWMAVTAIDGKPITNIKNTPPNILPPGKSAKAIGKVTNIRPGPCPASKPFPNTNAKMARPATKATRVSTIAIEIAVRVKDASGNVTQWGVRIPSSGFPYWLFQGLSTQNDVILANKN